jgi:hypothetical protein
VSEAEKREALAAVLGSTTFARSAQLRAFIGYVCEREMEGRAQELTEYQIALNVLGRGKDFNLTDDSTVRNRAYELRQRLEKFYSIERPDLRIEIQIPRGGYVPSYVRRSVDPAEAPRVGGIGRRAWYLAGAACLAIVVAWLAGYSAGRPHQPAVVREAWGPLADPGEDLVVSVAVNLHLMVRQHIAGAGIRFEAPQLLKDVYGPFRRPLEPGLPLYMEPAQLSIPLGEAVALASLCRVRQEFGGGWQILPEAEAPIGALRGRNAILIGSSTNSAAAALLLKSFPYTIDFTADDRFAVIDQRKPAGANQAFVARSTPDAVPAEHYGLITVITSPNATGNLRRTLVISASSSAGTQAAAEFFGSATHLRELRDRFARSGIIGFPANYQVVVRCKSSGARLVSYEYVMHALGGS